MDVNPKEFRQERRNRSNALIQAALQAALLGRSQGAVSSPSVPQIMPQPGVQGALRNQQTGKSSPAPNYTGDPDLDWLLRKESGNRVTAKNPKSTAFGLGQLLKANRKSYAAKLGISNPDTTDYNEQLAMMKRYIQERYGTARKAREFHQQHNWY